MSEEQQNIVDKIIKFYSEGKVSDTVIRKFLTWLASDVHEEGKDKAMMILWNSIDKKSNRSTANSFTKLQKRLNFVETPKRILTRNIWFKVAAVVLPLMIITTTVYFAVDYWDAAQMTFVTDPTFSVLMPAGINKQIELPDGSEVWLKGGSTLTYKENKENERLVTLEGEGYFTVSANPERPFFVNAKDLTVKAVGTQFDVDAYPDSELIYVSLEEGAVEAILDNKHFSMKEGQLLAYNRTTTEIVITDDINNAYSRKSTTISFENAPLAEIFGYIEKYYNATIRVSGQLPLEERYSTRFVGNESIGDVMEILQMLTGSFTYKTEGNNVNITMN